MSLFKAFANYCRKSNEKDRRDEQSRNQLNSFNYDLERKREESRKCCSNCLWAAGYCSMCSKHGYADITDPYNTVCDDFSSKR